MRALQLTAVGRPLVLVEIEDPEPSVGEVLIRVHAAGICHSDVHYRNGTSALKRLPLVPGHEIAGKIERVGAGVSGISAGDRVCVHYLRSCGRCHYCSMGQEQFCTDGRMIGKDCDGGFAELVAVPARSVFAVPDSVPMDHAAVMMCSSSTALHALKKAELSPGDTVAVFGLGGLGMSCIQLARNFAPRRVIAVDLDPKKLKMAEEFGAIPVNGAIEDPVAAISRLTGGRGADVSVELIGLPTTMRKAVECLAVFGRAALAGISNRTFEIDSYRSLIGKEAKVVGVSDHLASEIPLLLELAESGALDLSGIVARTVALDADAVNAVLDDLERFSSPVRTVIDMNEGTPGR